MPFPKSCLYSRCCDNSGSEFDCFGCVSDVLDHNNHVGLSVTSDPINEELIFTVAGGAGSVSIGQSLFVSDSLGSDISGTPNRLDLPYKTIQGALNDWSPNSTIFVFPGTYGLSAPITTPGADILRIHFFNGAQVNSLPESNIFIIRGGFYCTGHGVFNSAGSGFGSHAPFWISPSSSGTVYIEAEYIVGSVHGLYIDAGTTTVNVYVKTQLGIRGNNGNGVYLTGSNTLDLRSDVFGNKGFDNDGNGLVRIRESRIMSTGGANSAYSQLSLSNAEIYNSIFVAAPGATYSLDTNIASNIRLLGTSYANIAVDPNITQQIGSVVVDALVS